MALDKRKRLIINLIKRNNMDLEEVAEKAQIDLGSLYDLIAGEGDHSDPEFSAELRKADQLVEERINRRALQAQEVLYKKLLGWAKSKDAQDCSSKVKHQQMVNAVNALTKAAPNINIEQYTWKQGMTPQEAENEFRRLKGLAGQAAVRGRVQKSSAKRAKSLSVLNEPDDANAEAEQDTALRAKPETEGFSRKPSDSTGNFWRQ